MDCSHTRLPCPSPTPGVHPNPCPLSQWCHPTLILCCPLLLLPSIFPSIRVFSNESALRMRWPKYWSFSFSISPSSEHAGLISFRMDWLDLLAEYTLLKNRRITRITSIGINNVQGSGLQMLFSRSAVSDSLQLHGLQHSRLLCPSLSPRVCSNLCPLSWWCYPTILSCHPLLESSIFPNIRVFSNESTLRIRWPKY